LHSEQPENTTFAVTGRCYCGATSLTAQNLPQTVTYCHCNDCRRITGAPVAVFAAFATGDLALSPDPGPISAYHGVERWFCRKCGSPLAAQFDYLPEQIYVPIGVLDQADRLVPQLHCHSESRLPWLKIDDDLERNATSGRASLQAAQAIPDSV